MIRADTGDDRLGECHHNCAHGSAAVHDCMYNTPSPMQEYKLHQHKTVR